MASGNQTRRILIKVDTSEARGIREIAESMGLLNRNTKSLSGNMSFLTNAFKGWLGFLGVRELTRMSDEMQNITNRLKIFAGSTEGAKAALAQIADIAERTNQGVKDVGDVYARLATSLRSSGATTSELASLTESLINTFRVAGATTTETTNTIIQLSQAFASGELRGQELRSVMEQNATLAGLLRERFGQDIYKKAQDGAISVAEVLRVLAANQSKVNEEANKLAPTFEQTLTKSMNKITLAIGELNEKFELSSKFAAVMGTAMGNLAPILLTVGSLVLTLAITQIPALVTSVKNLYAAALLFMSSNPYTAAFAAISLVISQVYIHWDKLSRLATDFKATMYDVAAAIESATGKFRNFLGQALGVDTTNMNAKNKDLVNSLRERAEYLRMYNTGVMEGPERESPEQKMQRDMDSLIEKIEVMNNKKDKVKKIKDILGELNKQFQSGSISINEYNEKLIDFELYKVNREFSEGKMDIFKYHEQLRDLDLKQLNREFANGSMSIQEFNQRVAESKLKVLDEQVKAGKISLQEYNSELLKLEDKVRVGGAFDVGVQNYINSVGTLSQGIAKSIEQAFGHLETNFMDFIKTGKFNFRSFAQSVLDDLAAIIIRASIIRPLAQGILSGFGGSAYGGDLPQASYAGNDYLMPNAKGNAFSGGRLIPFAKGGIVDSPTAFTFGGGRNKGIMGEAGTEAILPLSRGSNGNLGVQASVTPVTINVINQSGSQVEQRETTGPNGEKTIDILITSKVREGIASGRFDTAMKSAYGIKRKGS